MAPSRRTLTPENTDRIDIINYQWQDSLQLFQIIGSWANLLNSPSQKYPWMDKETKPLSNQSEKKAIVLLNFGGPEHPGEVRNFLYEILRDPNTIQLPFPRFLQNRLAGKIATRRADETTRQYMEIGGKSPLVASTEQIATSLRKALKQSPALPVYIVHRYLQGWTNRVAARIKADGITHLLALTLYPHFSFATTGSSLEQLREELIRAGFEGRLDAVRSYPDASGYLDALTERLKETLKVSGAEPGNTVILCSAHGLPLSYVKKGDPYKQEMEATLAAIRKRFPEWRFDLSFQSRVGPAEWLKPYTDEYVPLLGREGFRHIVFLPLSFTSDHIETLYEIGVTYFDLARQSGLTPHLVPAVENHPAFITALADQVRLWIKGVPLPSLSALLPPDQNFRRIGVWVWGGWFLTLFAVFLFALL